MNFDNLLQQANESIQNKTILITGSLGFVGNNLIDYLVNQKIEFIATDNLDPESFDKTYLTNNFSKATYEILDITDKKSLRNLSNSYEFDYIIHLASLTNLTKDFHTSFHSLDINTTGTLRLLKMIKEKPIEQFVFLSTSDVYGEIDPPFFEKSPLFPASPYSISKASAEMFCNLFNKVENLPITILRAFNLYGKYQRANRFIPYVIESLLLNKQVKMTPGEQKREYNYVLDLIYAIVLSISNKNAIGKTINVGNGISHSIKDVALKIANIIGANIKLLRFGEIDYRPNEIWDMYCNNDLIKKTLNWGPQYDLDKGLKSSIKWYKGQIL